MTTGLRNRYMTELYDLREACDYLKISQPTMYRLIKQRKIAYSKIGTGRGTYRFKKEDLDAYLEKNRVEPNAEA